METNWFAFIEGIGLLSMNGNAINGMVNNSVAAELAAAAQAPQEVAALAARFVTEGNVETLVFESAGQVASFFYGHKLADIALGFINCFAASQLGASPDIADDILLRRVRELTPVSRPNLNAETNKIIPGIVAHMLKQELAGIDKLENYLRNGVV